MRWYSMGLASIALAFAGTASAQMMPGMGMGMGMMDMPMGHHLEAMEMLHGLDLTPDQRGHVHDIIHGAFDQARPLLEKMRTLRGQLEDAMLASGNVTEDQLKPLMQQKEQLRTQLDQIRLEAMLKVRAVLTPQQIAHAAELHRKLADLRAQERAILGGEE